MEQVAVLISEGIPIQLQVFPRHLKPLEELLCESTLRPRVGTVHPDITLRLRAHDFIVKTYFHAAGMESSGSKTVSRSKLGHGEAGEETQHVAFTCNVTWWPSMASNFHGWCIIYVSFATVKAAKLPRFKSTLLPSAYTSSSCN